MTSTVPYRICTPRLVLRCWQPADASLLKNAVDASLDHLRPWMPWAAQEPESLDVKIERLRKSRAQFDLDQQYVYGIFNREENQALGSSGLHRRQEEDALEIGYWIHAGWINQGLATETAAALTRAAFSLFHVNRVEIHCDARNIRSAAIPKKLGYTLDATLRRRTLSGADEERETMVWSIFADEFSRNPFSRQPFHACNVVGEELT